jgi:hypothetical protein
MDLEKIDLLILLTIGILSLISPGILHAGAAYIYEMANPSDTGYAGAGLAGRAGDAGTVFTNPAGMTRFKEPTIQAGLTPLYLYGPFDPDENTTVDGSDGDTTLFFAGALSGKLRDIGISDDFIKELGQTFQPGTSALFVLVHKATPDKVLKEFFKGKVIKTSLTKDKEAELREVLQKF